MPTCSLETETSGGFVYIPGLLAASLPKSSLLSCLKVDLNTEHEPRSRGILCM